MNAEETEAPRQEYLNDMDEDLDPKEFQPGSYGCHEALHMASFFMESVDRGLVAHPTVTMNPEWFALASQAHDALFALYQAIGTAHLESPDKRSTKGRPVTIIAGEEPRELHSANLA